MLIQLAVSESKASWVISLFVPQNENNVMSLVKFPLFMTFLTNQDVLVYTFENITQDALDSETANLPTLGFFKQRGSS